MKRTTLAVLLLTLCQAVFAYDFAIDNADGVTVYYTMQQDGTCAVAAGDELYSGRVTIPASVERNYKTLSVTAIASDAFLGCEKLTHVVIPEGITSIGSCAFSCCIGLTEVTIPSTVKVIGTYSFSGCKNLTYIDIPEGVTQLSHYAFLGCTHLASITLPSTITKMGHDVLLDTKWWNEQEEGPVYYNDILLGVRGTTPPVCTIKSRTRLIADGAFYNCTSLSWVDIPQSVTSIGSAAFSNCSGISTIIIPSSITSLEEYTFFNCKSLTSVSLPEGLTSIGWYTFSGCSNLTSLVLPSTLEEVCNEAFRGCVSLMRIDSSSLLPPSCAANAFVGVSRENCSLYVAEQSIDSYRAAEVWKEFNIVTFEEDGTFEKCGTPLITVADSKLSFTSDTPDATFHYTITSADIHSNEIKETDNVALTGQYTVTAYAKAPGKQNSDVATAILVWVNLDKENGVVDLEAHKPVVLRIDGNHAVLCGTAAGEEISLWDTMGHNLAHIKAIDGETTIPYILQKGQFYLVVYADKVIKFTL